MLGASAKRSRSSAPLAGKGIAAVHAAWPSARRAWFTTAVLTLVYTASYIDRQLPNLLIVPIKTELALSDTEVSLLSGLSFALLYSFAAIPMARLSDRWSRRGVITSGMLLWGCATTLCAFSGSFGSFFVARMGVGLGEAGLVPAAYSLLADLFPPEERARPTGLFVLGTALGGGLAMTAGALSMAVTPIAAPWWSDAFGAMAPWRGALLLTGLATLALLPLAMLITDPPPAARSHDEASFVLISASLWERRRAYAPLMLGIPLINLATYGTISWLPTFFIRTHGWSMAVAGLWVGGASIAGGIVGGMGGSWITDRLSRPSPGRVLRYCVWAIAACLLLTIALAALSDASAQLLVVAAFNAIALPVGVAGAVGLQAIAPRGTRAQISSFYLLSAAVVGVGLGPTIVALCTDYIFADENRLGWSMALVWAGIFAIAAPLFLKTRQAFEGLAAASKDPIDREGTH